MAKKKQSPASIAAAAARAAVEAANQSDAQVIIGEDDPESDFEEEDALSSLAALGADHEGARFIVKCLSPLDRKGTIEEVTRDELPELVWMLRDRYGPGKYSVHAQGENGYIKKSHRVITISSLAARTAAAPAAIAQQTDTQQWLREQEAREERRRAEAREDRKFMLQLAVSAIPALQGLLRPPSLADQAAALSAIKELNGGGGAGMEKMLETLLKGLELGKDLGGGGSADSWPGLLRELVKDLGPGASNLLTQIAERRAVAQGRPPGAFSPVPAIPKLPDQPVSAPPAPAHHPEVTDPMLATQLPLLTKLAGELLEFAANGADPGLCAEALVAKVPRAVRAFVKPEQLQGWLTHPDWWTVLEGFKPELKPYQGYCDDVRQTLLKLMSEPESEPENP